MLVMGWVHGKPAPHLKGRMFAVLESVRKLSGASLLHMMQFVQLTYIAALVVVLSAGCYQRPESHHYPSMVLAH